MGVLFILLALVEAIFTGMSMGIIHIGFVSEDKTVIIKIIPLIIIAIICAIATIATLKKKDKTKKTLEDEEDA